MGLYAPNQPRQATRPAGGATQIAPRPASKPIKYRAGGEEVELSPELIRSYLVSGDGDKVTDQEVMMFLNLCRYNHLNPWLKEVYLIKYNNSPATMVPGKEAFMKRAERNPSFAGIECGVVVWDGQGFDHRQGAAFYPAYGDTLIGGWAKVYRTDRQFPIYAECSLDEYVGRKANGEVNSQWASKSATMIRKVAVMQALREAFPNDFGALYGAEEQGIDEPREETTKTIPAEAQQQYVKPAPKKSLVEEVEAYITPAEELPPAGDDDNNDPFGG